MQSTPLINPTADLTHRQRLGRCYELSGLIALHNPHVTLVHGSIQGFNFPRIAHAWVELPDGSVWEPVTNKVWHHSIFDGFYRPQVTIKYDHQAICRLCARYEHWGPWNTCAA
jgi:hypothetical protein